MRYRADIEIVHLAGQEPLPEAGRAALRKAIDLALSRDHPPTALVDLAVVSRPGNVVHVRAEIQGRTIADMTSPLDAITLLDAALLRALAKTGLFEEFDVARRTVRVGPLDP